MSNKKIAIFCPATLFDNFIEYIPFISEKANSDLFIILSKGSLGATSINLYNNNFDIGIYPIEEFKEYIKNYEVISSYFNKIKNIYIVVSPKKISFEFIIFQYKFLIKIYQNKYNILLFDDIPKAIYFPALILSRKVKSFLTVHDPLPHTGESSYYFYLISYIRKKFDGLIFFSDYSESQYLGLYPKPKRLLTVKLAVYRIYKKLANKNSHKWNLKKDKPTILFFGRISKYKGIQKFLNSCDILTKRGMDFSIIIAGSGDADFIIPSSLGNNLKIINEYIDATDIGSLFNVADALICPYSDSTQSGVLMTAAAFGCPVIASNTGSFKEYIESGYVDGSCYDSNSENSLAESIQSVIKGVTFSKSLATANNNESTLHLASKLFDFIVK